METVIDWSKAPDWAAAYAQVIYEHETTAKDFAWISADGYNVNPFGQTEQVCHPYMKQFFTADRFRLIEFRPAKDQAWTCEGLPPIGMHVVVHDDGSLMYGQGESGEVLAHVDGTAVIRMSYGLGCFLPRCLRTPAQVAEEEREKAINEMVDDFGKFFANPRVSARTIYDAGYRKQVAP